MSAKCASMKQLNPQFFKREVTEVPYLAMPGNKMPYSKPPTSHYAMPAFYWRGGDVLREREYMTDEYRNAFADHHGVKIGLQRVQAEFQQATEVSAGT
jgi:hypothetical protein